MSPFHWALFAGLAAAVFLPSLLRAATVTRMQMVMGALLRIDLEGDSEAALESAHSEAFREATRLEAMLSNHKSNSEVSRINRAAWNGPVQVSDEMIKFILLSNRMSYLCDGFFDITVEPLTRLWRLRERRLDAPPTEEEISSATAKVNSNDIDISFHNNTVRFLNPGMGIDTGAIGKGYALDSCLRKIKESGSVQSASLDFGGELLHWSREPRDYSFSIKNPLDSQSAWDTFSMSTFSAARAVSTSGNYERFVEISSASSSDLHAQFPEGRFGPILNPKTGIPVRSEVRSVSVISASGAEADALSTAIFSMGLDKGSRFANQLAESAVLILYEETGKLRSFKSENWVWLINSQI